MIGPADREIEVAAARSRERVRVRMWVCGDIVRLFRRPQAWQCEVLAAKMADVTDAEKPVTHASSKDEKGTH